ncbi:MFS transporter [Chromobacterium amazonense]|uniref:MFS transporter n=1 Tax=Chromobacterium amazonense TaxID=1382803 RepID=UPI00237D8AE9|nr:MFS transporter [Chromobacterium amazonense]MDE1715955.1 MFS transporter [Chromobacterium amazonense]
MTLHQRYCLQQAWMWGAFGLMLPIMTLFLLRCHFSLFELGLYAAMFSLMAILFELPFGTLADRLGRIRVYRWSLLANIAGCAILLFSHHKFLIFFSAACFGMARAMNSGTVDAWYARLLRQLRLMDRIPMYLGRAELASALGLAIMSLLGGLLPGWLGNRFFDNPYKGCIGLSAVLFLLLLGLTPWLFWEKESPRPAQPPEPMSAYLREAVTFSWRDPGLKPLMMFFMLVGSVVSVLESYWPVVLKGLLPQTERTWIFGAFLTLLLVMKGLGGWFSHLLMQWCARRPSLSVGGPLMALAGSLLLANAMGQIHILILLLGSAVFFLGVAGTVINAMMHKRAPDTQRSRIASAFSLVFQFGSMLASVTLGYAVDRLGVLPTWFGVGCVVAVAAAYGLSMRLEAQQGEEVWLLAKKPS